MSRRYVQFYLTDRRGVVEMLGSDGVAFLDGRLSLPNLHASARSTATTRRRRVTHYQLRVGGDRPLTWYRPISEVTPIQ